MKKSKTIPIPANICPIPEIPEIDDSKALDALTFKTSMTPCTVNITDVNKTPIL